MIKLKTISAIFAGLLIGNVFFVSLALAQPYADGEQTVPIDPGTQLTNELNALIDDPADAPRPSYSQCPSPIAPENCAAYLAQQQAGDPNVFVANVPIGTFTGGNVNENLLGNYINAWYNLMLGVIGIVATVMIVWAGFKWLLARGDGGKISEAKEIIFSALSGLALALLSVTLLNIINPGLTTINLEGLKPVQAPTPIQQYDDPRLNTNPYNINQGGERSAVEKKLDQVVWEDVLALDPSKTEAKLSLDFNVPPTEYLPGGSFTKEVTFTQNPAGGYVAKWDGMSEKDEGVFLNVILNNMPTNGANLNWDVRDVFSTDGKLEGVLLVPRAYNR